MAPSHPGPRALRRQAPDSNAVGRSLEGRKVRAAARSGSGWVTGFSLFSRIASGMPGGAWTVPGPRGRRRGNRTPSNGRSVSILRVCRDIPTTRGVLSNGGSAEYTADRADGRSRGARARARERRGPRSRPGVRHRVLHGHLARRPRRTQGGRSLRRRGGASQPRPEAHARGAEDPGLQPPRSSSTAGSRPIPSSRSSPTTCRSWSTRCVWC